MTRIFFFILILGLVVGAPVVSARTYDSYQACASATGDGVSSDLVLDFCYSCIQDGGVWEFPVQGSDYGACRENTQITEQEAEYLAYVQANYTKTTTRCNFDDDESCHSLSEAHVCAEERPGFGYCYAPKKAGGENNLVNLLTVDTLEELLVKALELMVQVGTVLLVFALVLTGFRFVAAQGNPEAVTQAKKALMWVVIGGLLLLGAEALALVLQATITSL